MHTKFVEKYAGDLALMRRDCETTPDLDVGGPVRLKVVGELLTCALVRGLIACRVDWCGRSCVHKSAKQRVCGGDIRRIRRIRLRGDASIAAARQLSASDEEMAMC